MKILVRTDSSSSIGTGHVMRDLVLAKQYDNKVNSIIFAVQELKGNLNKKIVEEGYRIEILNSNNVDELLDIVNKLKINMLIIDHYHIDYKFEKVLKTKTGVKLMVLDDLYEKHYCDILLNHNIYATPQQYTGLVPRHCELKCGKKYTLLRNEFHQIKSNPTALKNDNTFNIFLAMGGTDIANLNPKIISVLSLFQGIHVYLVTTSSNTRLTELQNKVKNKNWISLCIDTDNIATLMMKSKLAIVTASVTLNEVLYMDLPFVAIKVADNQKYMSEYLVNTNQNILEEYNTDILYSYITKYIKK